MPKIANTFVICLKHLCQLQGQEDRLFCFLSEGVFFFLIEVYHSSQIYFFPYYRDRGTENFMSHIVWYLSLKVKVKVAQSCLILCNPHGLYSPWNSPGQSTGVGSLSLLQGIFPTQGSNTDLPHCRQILYQLSHSLVLRNSDPEIFQTLTVSYSLSYHLLDIYYIPYISYIFCTIYHLFHLCGSIWILLVCFLVH